LVEESLEVIKMSNENGKSISLEKSIRYLTNGIVGTRKAVQCVLQVYGIVQDVEVTCIIFVILNPCDDSDINEPLKIITDDNEQRKLWEWA
jgi:hypothetical protein